MKRGVKYYLMLVLVGAALYGVYHVMVSVLDAPLYLVLLVYLTIMAAYLHFNRKNAWAVRGNYYYISGNIELARTTLKKAIDAGTKSPSAHIYYALILLRQEKNTAEAFKLLEKVKSLITSVMDERNYITALATCYWLDGNLDKGIEVLEDMRNGHEYTNAGVLTTLGFMYIIKGNYDAARKVTQEALADDESYGAAWDNMGQICYKIGDMAGAKENFNKALEKRENLADANYYLGLIAEQDGETASAAEYFRKASICTLGFFNTATAEKINAKYEEYVELSEREGDE